MPTSSITKKFIIKDDKTCDRLIAALAETKPQQIKKSSNSYEKGKEKLAYYFGRPKESLEDCDGQNLRK